MFAEILDELHGASEFAAQLHKFILVGIELIKNVLCMRFKRRFKIKPGAQLPQISVGFGGRRVELTLLHYGCG